MGNWKTTVGGGLGILGVVLPHFGISIELANALSVVGLAVMGWFARDK